MFWLISTALAGWQVTESSFKVSEHDLWTSDQPNIVVDKRGNVWVGYATRYDDERYHTGGFAMLDEKGEWQLTSDVFSEAKQAHVALSPNGVVAFGSLLSKVEIFPIWSENQVLTTIFGEVRVPISYNQVWGVKDKHWTYFEHDGTNWIPYPTDKFDDNSVHENAITGKGLVARIQDKTGWLGYYLIKKDGTKEQVFETSDSYDVYAVASENGLAVLAQKDLGGGNSALSPVLLWTEGEDGFSEKTITDLELEKPACKLEKMSCKTDAVKKRAIGLINPEWPILLEYQLEADWRRECTERGEAPPFRGHEYQPPAPCLKYGGWSSSPSFYSKASNPQLRIGKDIVPLKKLPKDDKIGYISSEDTAHLVWYEKRTDGTWVNYVQAKWQP